MKQKGRKRSGRQKGYTNAIDIWSLGVFGMEYTVGLPSAPKPWDHSSWTRRIIARVASHQDMLGDLLAGMLHKEPQDRLSASSLLRLSTQYPANLEEIPDANHSLEFGDPGVAAATSHQLSTIQEDSFPNIQPEEQLLDDRLGTAPGWLQNPLCVGSELAEFGVGLGEAGQFSFSLSDETNILGQVGENQSHEKMMYRGKSERIEAKRSLFGNCLL
ncbi:hypothetical protein ONS95_006905 [Cadophora gregata]|uniref:uncharacterized protein n=1 Tax=Cadophora gregata TaxID=51156 RepID=UPI0026DB62D3|nr:uncharacterized protein ONS95_006905 [Cadophora gregata]KAK0101753.1 hypothetical protein ONS95_006905 [Cadophora gregata]